MRPTATATLSPPPLPRYRMTLDRNAALSVRGHVRLDTDAYTELADAVGFDSADGIGTLSDIEEIPGAPETVTLTVTMTLEQAQNLCALCYIVDWPASRGKIPAEEIHRALRSHLSPSYKVWPMSAVDLSDITFLPSYQPGGAA